MSWHGEGFWKVEGLGALRIHGLTLRKASDLGFGVWGLGFRGLGLKVSGLGFGALRCYWKDRLGPTLSGPYLSRCQWLGL